MTHVAHELAAEFPELKDRIHELKMKDAHFQKLFEAYHKLNREVHRIEAAGVNVADAHFENLKKERMSLKDELYEMLTA